VLPFRTLSLALTAALGFVPLMPPEHAHETETDGHRQIVLHQHSEPHAIGHLPAEHGPGRAFDHPDEPILTLSAVYTTSPLHVPAAPIRTVVAVVQPPQAGVGRASNRFVELLIHGPPSAPAALRGPPASLA
jgi:hypothetical protein